MDNTQQSETFNKFALPIQWGVIIGIVGIIIFTAFSMFMAGKMQMTGSIVMGMSSFIIIMLLLLVMANQQKKAMGGYITFKQAFQAVFVSILIIVAMSQIYSLIYVYWIDPDYIERAKDMASSFSVTIGGDSGASARQAQAVEESIDNQYSLSGQLLSFAGSVILYSLFGFIIAAVVKRNKPEHLA